MKQYASSPILNSLVDYRRGYFDNGWGDQFYSLVWNVDTAQGFGLDIWGKIVVVGRELQIPQTDYFGFTTTPNQSWSSFGEYSFYSGPEATNTYILADNAYRVLILAKALSNISATDCKSLNKVLSQLFPGRGRAWVNDLGNMQMRVTFEFALDPWERSVLNNGKVFPRPAGVMMDMLESPAETFGFFEAGDCLPFNQGTFLPNGAVSNVA